MKRLFESSGEGARMERKFYISLSEAAALRERLSAVMMRDRHGDAQGRYTITSVYFDTPGSSSRLSSEMGLMKRKKYRIRAYNHCDDFICLECKRKNGNRSYKSQQRITRADYDSIMRGDPSPLLAYQGDLAKRFYYEMRTNLYRPRNIVEYTRESFVHPMQNTRITFDTNLLGTSLCPDLFCPRALQQILPRDVILLEVKYRGFLPPFLHAILPLDCMPATANCKYLRACTTQLFD